jgi:amino acid adenylation domain-containing protein
MAKPSIEMMVGILGILKAGGAYLPIDPEYPQERIDFLLKDSGAKILLSKLSRVSGLSKEPTHLTHLTHPTQLCYVIYTSGTTGKPKGVMLTHKNLVNYVSWFVNEARVRENDKTILTSSFAFDLGYTSIYPSILSGAELHILAKEEYLADEYLLAYIKKKGITYLKLTPSFFTIIANSPNFSPGICPALRLVVLGGEAINAGDVEKAHRICPHIEFINHYGPTEATIGCIAQYIDFNTIVGYKKQPGIGHPIHNMKAYILDKRLNPVSIGVPGELCLSGTNIARGYLNRPELTLEKFNRVVITNDRLYRTGDLARWLPDGTIEFLGRFDHQVKIRGYRIELGEIQEQLLKHENIEDAVVLALEDKRKMKYLCAYIVPIGMDIDFGEETEVPGLKLKEYLSRHLPDYMIPSHVVKIEKVPLTPNGKLDTRALPSPEFDSGAGYTAPRDPLEEKLVELWAGLLESGVEQIGIDDNFFQLGGHSISAAILLSRIHKEFSVKLSLVELFKRPAVKGLAHIIKGMQREKYMHIKPAAEKEYYNLSSAQKRVYFFQQMEPASSSYNLTAVVILEGELERERLEHTFRQLIRRHESLRTSIKLVEDEPVLKIHQDVEFEVEYIEEKIRNIEELVEAFVRCFALNAAPLLRVALVKLEQARHLLMVDMHHIISDGLSRRIFLKEVLALYAGKELPGLSLTFKDYTEWQNNETEQERIKRQGEFWINEFAGEIPILNLPTDYERPAIRSLEGDTVYFELDREESGQLKEIAYRVNATIFMVLLAVYSILLSKLSGQEDIIVGCPVTGRGHADLEPIIGMFVNMVGLRNFPQGHKTFRSYLNEVRERTIRAFENQDYPFEELVDRIKINRTANRNPIFDVCFSMQGMEILEVEMGGVKLKPYEFQKKYARFDMAFVVDESEDRLKFGVEYSTKLFKVEMIERFINYFKEIVSIVVSNQNIPLKDVLISHDLLTSSSVASLEAESDFGF